ncbi:hypothetical protein PAXRUDRAFT_20989 [Paxillus rubicundulus Ve08.2h10]|uniref:Uncharacterized protein n=1 Tax=Paxillus rubicundulus Ve08.2h10 TaxID=930991 RepID=A0A0D0CCU6_9AGAM|nr:hypothetical protein PAXRUDRAFT_20989 [Paxillus rubicundulus Ve08.2h10]
MDSEQALQLRVDPPGGGAEVRTPGSRESGGTNSGLRESGVGVPVPEFTAQAKSEHYIYITTIAYFV